MDDESWIAACAHRLHQRWRTVAPDDLEAAARDLAADPTLRRLAPADAAARWLRPVDREPIGQ